MPNASMTYNAKRATALVNPITNDSIFVAADNAATSAFVGIPGNALTNVSLINGVRFYINAAGTVTTGTSSTLIVTLYYVSANVRTAITYNGTGVTSTGATFTSAAYATKSGNWYLESNLIWDYTSQVMGGSFAGYQSATPALTASTVTTGLTAVDLSQNGCGFICGAHFGSTNASNTVSLTEFILEVN